MESYNDHYESYDSLPSGLLVAVMSKEPTHVTSSRDPALRNHCLCYSPVQVTSGSTGFPLSFFLSFLLQRSLSTSDCSGFSTLSVGDRVAAGSSSACVLVDIVTSYVIYSFMQRTMITSRM